MRPNWRFAFILTLLVIVPLVTAQESPVLRVSGNDIQTTEMTAAMLAKMPRLSLDLRDPHSGEVQRYEGVRLSDLLAKAGVALGDKLRGRALAMYVLAQASDGYAVAFSIAELDPAMSENQIIVADRMNGKPLDAKQGPFKIVVPSDKRPARWIRMLTALKVESALSPSGSSPQ
jgi:hypothetical protein